MPSEITLIPRVSSSFCCRFIKSFFITTFCNENKIALSKCWDWTPKVIYQKIADKKCTIYTISVSRGTFF